MSSRRHERLAGLMLRARGGQVDLAELAAALGALELMAMALDPSARDGEKTPGEGPAAVLGTKDPAGRFVPYLFTESRLASAHGERHEPGASTEPGVLEGKPQEHLERVLRRGWSGVVFDPDSDHALTVDRGVVRRLSDLMRSDRGATDTAPQATGTHIPGEGTAPEFPISPPVAPPSRNDEASLEVLQQLQGRLRGGGQIPIWEELETLAFDLDWYIPAAPREPGGKCWPLIEAHPDDPAKRVVHAYCEAAPARNIHGEREVLHLSGIEAFRWIRGAPAVVHEVILNHYHGTEAWLQIPVEWLLTALYPELYELPSLEDVRRVSPERVGRLPGARGLRPEAIRAFAGDWQTLISAAGPDESVPSVEREGCRYMPVFSSADTYFELDGANPGLLGGPRMHADAPPFDQWLAEIRDLDGVLLDPTGRGPLALDHTDLLLLSLWCRDRSQPGATEIVHEVARLHAAGLMDDAAAGRAVGDWPQYWLGTAETDGEVEILMVPDLDCCAMFTSEGRVALYVESLRVAGLLDVQMKPVPVYPDWRGSVFHHLLEHYEHGCWIDPMPPDGGLAAWNASLRGELDVELDPDLVAQSDRGLHVAGEMLLSAATRLREHLRPRFPDWLGTRRAA